MSRIAFISDIHGNLAALTAVMANIRKQAVDAVYCLGDLVGYYSRINEVIDLIRSEHIPCIIGNHDDALIHHEGCIERSKTCTQVLQRQLTYITPDNLAFLKSLGDSLTIGDGKSKIFTVHGGMGHHVDEYLSSVDEAYFSALDDSYTHVVTAHSHIPKIVSCGRIMYANCGSVGQPRDYNPHSSYLLMDDGECKIIRVPYPIEETIDSMQLDGFPDYIAEVLKRGCKIGG